MNRLKGLVAIPIALIVMTAFASSATANSLPGLEQEGKPLPVGKILELNSIPFPGNFRINSYKIGTLECESALLEGEVTVNEAGPTFPNFVIEQSGRQEIRNCNRAGARVEIFDIHFSKLKSIIIGGQVRISGPLSFEMELSPGGTICRFSGTSMKWSFVPGSSVLKLDESAMKGEPIACLGAQVQVSAEFSVSSGGKPVIIN